MKPALTVFAFAARHFLFVLFAIAFGCVCWTVGYGLLLLIALGTHAGLGGPLAWPAGLFAIIVGGGMVGWGVFAPACAVGALFCRMAKLPRLAAIPVVLVAAGLIALLGYWGFIKGMTTHSMPPITTVIRNGMWFLPVPLGVHWWLTEGPGALFDTFRHWLQRRRRRRRTLAAGSEQHPPA